MTTLLAMIGHALCYGCFLALYHSVATECSITESRQRVGTRETDHSTMLCITAFPQPSQQIYEKWNVGAPCWLGKVPSAVCSLLSELAADKQPLLLPK